MSQFHGQKWPHGKAQMTFLAREAQGTHFLAREAQVAETGFLVTFLQPVSGSVSRHVKKPQSGKIREGTGKVSGKSNN